MRKKFALNILFDNLFLLAGGFRNPALFYCTTDFLKCNEDKKMGEHIKMRSQREIARHRWL